MRDAVDACLTKAFRDVAVPEGLAERLLAGLAVERPRRRSRRWLLAGGGLLAAAASIVLAVWLGGPKAACVSEECAIRAAIRSFNEDSEQPGQLLANQSAPADYPFSPSVWKIRGTTWRHLAGDGLLGHPGVVYDLGPAGTHAALYVVACDDVKGVGTTPPPQPTSDTAGCCASAWQEGGLLYILVVEGDRSMYGRYLIPRSPVA